jgi:hypothetical protein
LPIRGRRECRGEKINLPVVSWWGRRKKRKKEREKRDGRKREETIFHRND